MGGINNSTYYNYWGDAVFFSTDTFPNTSSNYFGSSILNNPLTNGQTYSQQMTFNAPNGLSGEYYLLAFSDFDVRIVGEKIDPIILMLNGM